MTRARFYPVWHRVFSTNSLLVKNLPTKHVGSKEVSLQQVAVTIGDAMGGINEGRVLEVSKLAESKSICFWLHQQEWK